MERITINQAIERALAHYARRELPQTEAICRQILAQLPGNPHALHLLGLIANDVGRPELAYDYLKQALSGEQRVADLHNNFSVVCRSLGRLDEAAESAKRAVALAPGVAPYLNNLGIAQVFAGSFRDALVSFEKAVAADPSFAEAHDSLGLTLLLLGDLPRGFREQEWRWQKSDTPTPRRHSDHPQWLGQDLSGKTILVYAEQGYGDTFQFVRYIPMLKARGARVALECPPDVGPLLETVGGIDTLVTDDAKLPPFDFQSPLLSLPLAFGTAVHTIPADVPYLHADPQKTQFWADRLKGDANLKVGLVWSGRPTFKLNQQRSVPLKSLAPLGGIPGVSLYSLQKGEAAQELRQAPADFRIHDLSGDLTTFADTAAVIMNLDLVISMCTSVAHLTGALARPAWVMLSFVADWRWMTERSDTPWYPTMRLFRQPARQDWASVISEIESELRRLVDSRPPH